MKTSAEQQKDSKTSKEKDVLCQSSKRTKKTNGYYEIRNSSLEWEHQKELSGKVSFSMKKNSLTIVKQN